MIQHVASKIQGEFYHYIWQCSISRLIQPTKGSVTNCELYRVYYLRSVVMIAGSWSCSFSSPPSISLVTVSCLSAASTLEAKVA